MRRRRRLREKTETLGREAVIEAQLAAITPAEGEADDDMPITDDRLRLIFTCCHPALPMDARVALTLRTLGGLTTPEDRTSLPGARVDVGAATGPGQAQDP